MSGPMRRGVQARANQALEPTPTAYAPTSLRLSARLTATFGVPKRSTGEIHKNTEEPMAEQGAQYDHIGSKYDEYARTATLKQAECYTFFRMVGVLEGQRTMDLACGFGFYTRLLKAHGAAHVIGVDISPE